MKIIYLFFFSFLVCGCNAKLDTPLMDAVEKNDCLKVEQLINSGVDVNQRTVHKSTALHQAVVTNGIDKDCKITNRQ